MLGFLVEFGGLYACTTSGMGGGLNVTIDGVRVLTQRSRLSAESPHYSQFVNNVSV